MRTSTHVSSTVFFSAAVFVSLLGGCAAQEATAAEQDERAGETEAQSEALTVLPPPLFEVPKFYCSPIRVSSTPRPFSTNSPLCPPADPFVGQARYEGPLDGVGVTLLLDRGISGRLTCRPDPLSPIGKLKCEKAPDVLMESTCTEIIKYECPCGLDFKTVNTGDGAFVVAACSAR